MTTATSSTIVNNHSGQKYQPGFDSVPDLIRYYVGGADDNAVLSYGGGSEGMMGSNMFPQALYTEVRIRYPCNRRRSLIMMSNETTNPTFIPDIIDQTQMIRQNSHTFAAASVLTEVMKVQAPTPMVLPEKTSSLSRIHHKSRPPSPPPYKIRPSSSFRLSPRKRIPSATVTSMTCSESSSHQKLLNKGLALSTTLPRQSFTSLSQLEITQRPSTSRSHSTLPVASSSQCSKSLPRPLTSHLRPSTSKFSSSNSDQTNVELAHTALSLLGTFNLTPSTTISVINKPKTSIEPSLEIKGSLKLSETPSTSSSYGTNIDVGNRQGMIDIDAEIAAALSQAGDFDNDEDLSKMFTLSRFVDVQSSFSPVNVGNVQNYKSGSGRSRPNRSETYWNKFNNSQRTSRVSQNFDFNPSTSSNTSNNNSYRTNLKKHQFPLSPSNNSSQRSPILGEEASKGQGQGENEKQAEKNYYEQFEHGEQQYTPQEVYQRSTKSSNTEDVECITKKSNPPENQNTCEEGVNNKTKFKSREEERELEHWADAEVKRLERDGEMDPDEDSDDEELGPPLEPLENEDFEEWRNRRTNVIRHRFSSPDQRRQERSRRRRTRLMGLRFEKLRQQRTWCEQNQVHVDNKTLKERSKTETEYCTVSYRTAYNINHKIMPEVHNNRDTGVTTENMVSQWLLQAEPLIKNDQKDTMVRRGSQNDQVSDPNHLQQLRSQRCKPTVMPRDHRSPAGDDPPPPGSSPSPVVDDPLPIGQKTSQSGDNPPPAGDDTPSAGDDQSAGDNPPPVESNTPVAEDHSSLVRNYLESEKSIPKQFSIINRVPNQQSYKKDIIDVDYNKQHNYQYDHNQSSSIDNAISLKVDYENIMAFDDRENDYENICLNTKKKNCQKKGQRPLYNDNKGSTVIMAALRAIHLAIIGDPEDSPGAITVAGTGRLAAALCGADGRVTILPYRRHSIDCERKRSPVEPYLSTCPLQLLGQLGPAGRRARLDVIER